MGRLALVVAVLASLVAGRAAAEPINPGDVWVADGDTIRAHGKTYRLVGFDAPETARARCAAEQQLGARATERLQAIVNLGALDLTEVRCSCAPGTHGTRSCNFGRLCGKLTAKGEDVGTILIREGLARPFHCGEHRCPRRQGWCPE
jgi:endonuclease YncB( thermonuclease family)